MLFNTFLKSIAKIEELPLPGQASQFKMSPPFRQELLKKNETIIKNAKQSAVLALCYPKQDETYLILILRKTYKGVHSAQVGFPGGKVENTDKNLEATAIRETNEEIGVNPKSINIVKALTQVYIPPSNFNVQPFLGYCLETPKFTKEEKEVETILEIPANQLINSKNVINKSVSTSYKVNVVVPAFNLNKQVVWGATAMILQELKDLLKNSIS